MGNKQNAIRQHSYAGMDFDISQNQSRDISNIQGPRKHCQPNSSLQELSALKAANAKLQSTYKDIQASLVYLTSQSISRTKLLHSLREDLAHYTKNLLSAVKRNRAIIQHIKDSIDREFLNL